MGYQILDRPAGTLGYKQGMGEQLAGIGGEVFEGLNKGMKDNIFRKAIGNSQLEPSYEQDAEGNWKVKYAPKKTGRVSDQKFKIGMALGGYAPMSSIVAGGEKTMKDTAPFAFPTTEGGSAGTPPGATAKDGIYYDAQGNEIGSYLEEAGPENKLDAKSYDNVVRQALRQQVMGDPIMSSTLGLKKEKTVEEKAQEKVDLENAVNKVKGEKYGADERKMVSIIRQYKNRNAPVEDIQKRIRLAGYEPENFVDELMDYNPQPKKSGGWPWAQKPSSSVSSIKGAENIM